MNNTPQVLVLGAGRSATYLIEYLLRNAPNNYFVCVADLSVELALQKVGNNPNGTALMLDLLNTAALEKAIESSHIVISMVPAFMHMQVANVCLEKGKSMFTASYTHPEMLALHDQVNAKGLLFLNEMGLDPGIDHFSALHVIEAIKKEGGKLTGFSSYCGGLIAPNADNNPWHYKFSWNPRNVVLAGSAGSAIYKWNGEIKTVPYQRLFKETRLIEVPGFGELEAYANRDSLHYLELYGLHQINTLVRGTFRYPGFCAGWHVLVQLGLTDNQTKLPYASKITRKEFLMRFLPANNLPIQDSFIAFCQYLGFKTNEIDDLLEQFSFLGFFDEIVLNGNNLTAAEYLQQILENHWELAPNDSDLIAMHHIFEYTTKMGEKRIRTSTLVLNGEDSTYTAMAKTVGLPLAIAAHRYLIGKLPLTGVQIPNQPAYFNAILDELTNWGVNFIENDSKA